MRFFPGIILFLTIGLVACNNTTSTERIQDTAASLPQTELLTAVDRSFTESRTNQSSSLSIEILNRYNHDRNAFTQGLQFKDGILYEGTGLYFIWK